MVEKTLAIIKPEAVAQGHSGMIIALIELNKFSIIAMKKVHLTKKDAEQFYAVHKERPFYQELVESMTEGPVIVMALEKEHAIKDWRDLMGATNPASAGVGTIRKMFGTSIGSNATHGSDALETAQIEVPFFFSHLS
jgi:nucleoside-diphosphate kinase